MMCVRTVTIIWSMVAFSALLLVCAVGANAERLYGQYGQLFQMDYHPKIQGEVKASIRWWARGYVDCMETIARGEYETKDEYQARKAKAVRGCSALWPLQDTVVSFEGNLLSYDADREVFRFEIDLGAIRRPSRNRGMVTKQDEKKWRELDILVRQDGTYFSNDVCWVSKFRPGFTAQTNENYFDGDLTVNVYQESRSYGDDQLFEICSGLGGDGDGDPRIVVLAKASIQKARSLKAIEDHLRLELTGDSSRLRRVSGRNHRTYWIFHITQISLVDSRNSTVMFRTIPAN